MKQCPKCNRSYDDSQAFCLMDGTPLTNESEVETIARQSPAPKKSKLLLWLGLVGLVILAGGVIAAGLLFYKFSGQSENTKAKQQGNVSISPSPMLASPAKATPTSANTSPNAATSPKTEDVKPTPNNKDSEDITPIGWDTTATGFTGDDGQIYKFRCPAEGTEHTIWGSDVYTQDSSICTAAVHVGLFSLADGGVVTVEFRPGFSWRFAIVGDVKLQRRRIGGVQLRPLGEVCESPL